jgi:hypothetical protein
LDPRLSEARELNDLGVRAQNLGNWTLAAQYFERAVEKDPNSTLYRENLNNARKQIEIAERKAREEAKRREHESLRAQRDQLEAARGNTELKLADSSNLFGLKPSNPGSSDLRTPGKPVTRDFSGPHPVWKQLNCAVDIMGKAVAKANPAPGVEPSFTESRNLLGEALDALNGETRGVPCSMGQSPPVVSGQVPDFTHAVNKQRELIERARTEVDQLENAGRPVSEEERIAKIYAQQRANQDAIAERDAAALKRPRKQRTRQAEVPPPPKRDAKPKSNLEKLQEEAQSLVSFPVHKLKRRTPLPK